MWSIIGRIWPGPSLGWQFNCLMYYRIAAGKHAIAASPGQKILYYGPFEDLPAIGLENANLHLNTPQGIGIGRMGQLFGVVVHNAIRRSADAKFHNCVIEAVVVRPARVSPANVPTSS